MFGRKSRSAKASKLAFDHPASYAIGHAMPCFVRGSPVGPLTELFDELVRGVDVEGFGEDVESATIGMLTMAVAMRLLRG